MDKIIIGEIPGLVLQTHPYTKGLFHVSVVQLLFLTVFELHVLLQINFSLCSTRISLELVDMSTNKILKVQQIHNVYVY